jgi:hypothetical protein
MTISRRTAILAELAKLDEQIIAAASSDHEQLEIRRRSLERELAGLFVGRDEARSHHPTWGPAFKRGSERRRAPGRGSVTL